MTQPQLPTGIKEDFAFAVVNGAPKGSVGSFDTQEYPIFVPPWSKDATLAIGGWNNSMSSNPPWGPNGFYQLVEAMPKNGQTQTTTSKNNEDRFHASITKTLNAGKGAWTSVCLDFENYDGKLAPEQYTKLVIDTYNYLKTNHPTVQLKMCVSPSSYNRTYFNIQEILKKCPDLQFQIMCYDYALGQSGQTMVIPNDPISGPEGKQTIESDLDYFFTTDKVPQERTSIGVPEYGIIYNLETALSPQEVLRQINDGWSLKAHPTNPYDTKYNGNGQITNEQIVSLMGGSWTPSVASGWVPLVDQWGKTYYYHQGRKQVIAATPPDSLNDLMGDLVRRKYPKVLGFFGWEAIGDNAGKSMQTFMNQFSAAAPAFLRKMNLRIRGIVQMLQMGRTFLVHSVYSPTPASMGKAFATKFADSTQTKMCDSCSIDMKNLYKSWLCENAVCWWKDPVTVDQEKVDQFLDAFFRELKSYGIKDIHHHVEKLSDIFDAKEHVKGSSKDTLSLIYRDNFPVGLSGRNFFQYFCDRATENGMTNTLICKRTCNKGHTLDLPHEATASAKALVDFMKDANIQSVDFSFGTRDLARVEGSVTAKEFFAEVKRLQEMRGCLSTLTTFGTLDSKHLAPINSYFDRFHILMTPTCLENPPKDLVQHVGGDPSKISIGFDPKMAYVKRDREGKPLSKGHAAAHLYLQAAQKLGVSIDQLAPVFWKRASSSILMYKHIYDFQEELGKVIYRQNAGETLYQGDSTEENYRQIGRRIGQKKEVLLLPGVSWTSHQRKLPWKKTDALLQRTYYKYGARLNISEGNLEGIPSTTTAGYNPNFDPGFNSNDPSPEPHPRRTAKYVRDTSSKANP